MSEEQTAVSVQNSGRAARHIQERPVRRLQMGKEKKGISTGKSGGVLNGPDAKKKMRAPAQESKGPLKILIYGP